MILIDKEAKRNLKSPLDIEGFGRRFKTNNNLFSFPDPNLETIDKNIFYLLRHSKEINLENKYKYKPEYLSYDQYGITILGPLLMYVNGIFSVEDFDVQKVVVPSIQAITYILKDSHPNLDANELEEITW